MEIIEFTIDEVLDDGSNYTSHFAMNVAKVLSIIRRPDITSIPGDHHPASLGTFDLRGKVMPLVDLARWMGKTIRHSETCKVIVSEFSGLVTAFLVSGVARIHRMNWKQVEPPGLHLQSLSNDSITGVVRFDDRIIFLLDMEQVIASMNPNLSLDHHGDRVETTEKAGDYTVLIADDSGVVRSAIAKALQRAGFKVLQASSGQDAWETLEALVARASEEGRPLSHLVNLVISDIEMPEMDGHALTRKIKEDPRFKSLPVILFSSLISEVVMAKGISAGADDQITKPDLPQLAERAVRAIEKYRT